MTLDLENFIDNLAKRIVQYIDDGSDSSIKTIDYMSIASRSNTSDIKLSIEGHGPESVMDDIDLFLKQCVKTNRGEFMNPLWGGLNITALAGEIIAALTNQSMYTYEIAPLATLIEQTILKRMSEIIGFSDGYGTLTTGGSNGNMLGMLCARQSILPKSSNMGFDGSKYVSFVSHESHYSVLMSANVVGIGHQNVIKVACDDQGRMKPSSLKEEIERTRNEGLIPFCIIATSGTTVRGAFDPLREIAEISHDENLWLHVDAAWGGSCLFSANKRRLMDGVELADSVCWDAHKMMGMPLICSAFLVKDSHVLKSVCSHGDVAHYLFHEESKDFDLGRYSLQCGRRNDSLKLWLAWREIGDSGWSNMVEKYCTLSDYLEQKVVDDPELEMMSQRDWTNVCFRYNNDSNIEDLNELNAKIRDRLFKEGEFLVSRSNIGEDVIIRCVISNPSITTEILDGLIARIKLHASEIFDEIPSNF
jgi:glutamate/tyrosine decarboxylase-like PLP-dependent enzyme